MHPDEIELLTRENDILARRLEKVEEELRKAKKRLAEIDAEAARHLLPR